MKSLIKPAGYSVESMPDGSVVMKHLFTCCHCQFTWEAEVESMGGKLAGGFCGKCVGYICKNPACLECVHYERRLENIEAGRPLLTPAPARVIVPELWLS